MWGCHFGDVLPVVGILRIGRDVSASDRTIEDWLTNDNSSMLHLNPMKTSSKTEKEISHMENF